MVDGSYPASFTIHEPGTLVGWEPETPLYSESVSVAVNANFVHSSAFLELIASRDEIVIAQVTHDTAAAAVGPHTASAVLIGNTSTGGTWTHVAHWHWTLGM